MEDSRFVYPENARSGPYRAQLDEIVAAGVCPFCPEHRGKWKREPVIREGKYWDVTPVDWAYDGSLGHYMLVAKQHVRRLRDFPEDERAQAKLEMLDLKEWVETNFALSHQTFIIREGGPETGATVSHLHAQIISAGEKQIITRVG